MKSKKTTAYAVLLTVLGLAALAVGLVWARGASAAALPYVLVVPRGGPPAFPAPLQPNYNKARSWGTRPGLVFCCAAAQLLRQVLPAGRRHGHISFSSRMRQATLQPTTAR